MRKVFEGTITLFHHFSSPPVTLASLQQYEECGMPNLVYRKGAEGKLSLVNSLNIKK